jgi:hypothetical protein
MLTRSLVVVVASLLAVGTMTACDPVTGLTLGVVLDQELDHVGEIASSATAQANGLVISASTAVQLAIGQMRTAYSESLDEAIDSLDALTSKKLEEIQSMVAVLESQVAGDLRELTSRAQTLASTLPFANNEPKVGSYQPHFAVSDPSGGAVDVQLVGLFAFAKDEGYLPTLRVAGEVINPAVATDQTLRFAVPRAALGDGGTGMAGVSLTLSVPYRAKQFLVFHAKKEAIYSLSLTVVRAQAADMQLVRYATLPQVRTVHKRVDYPDEINSLDNRPHDVPYAVSPDTDPSTGRLYTVVPGSTRCIKTWSDGRSDVQGVWLQGEAPPTCVAWTRDGGYFYADGRIRFAVEFDQWLALDPTYEPRPAEVITVRWGEVKQVPVTPGSWELSYVSIDGKSSVIRSAPFSDRFVTITLTGDALSIAAKDLEGVTW